MKFKGIELKGEFELKCYDGCFEIYQDGNVIYFEDSDGYWEKREYDSDNNVIYLKDSYGFWTKREYDSNGNVIYYEDRDGYWYKQEYDSDGNQVYCENSDGVIRDNRKKVTIELTQEQLDKIKHLL